MVHRIGRWDPSKLGPHPRILLIGRSGSGKSTALRDVLSHIAGNVDLCLMFSPTTESIEAFRAVAPPGCVHPGGLKIEIIEAALRMNRELVERGKARELFIVADDVAAADKQLFRSPVMRDLLMNGRHARTGTALCLQYCMDVPVDARSQFQIIIVCAENNHANRRRIWTQFAGVVPTYRAFDAIMQRTTADHGCLVIDNSDPSATVETSIFHWKARLNPPRFTLCRSVYWKLDRKRPQQKEDVLVVAERRQLVGVS